MAALAPRQPGCPGSAARVGVRRPSPGSRGRPASADRAAAKRAEKVLKMLAGWGRMSETLRGAAPIAERKR